MNNSVWFNLIINIPLQIFSLIILLFVSLIIEIIIVRIIIVHTSSLSKTETKG